jgi:DNA polymerase-3 subunit gamma/tau
MSQKALALKYRPRRFSDVVGQRLARLVLQRMIQADEVRGAYLFHGSLGSGKTTMARVLAAALNCEHDDVNERPCGVCSTCELTAEGRSSDVTEIDAASHGKADDMRALRERARYAAQGRYRVIILDEVHALSDTGFDALLKVLEEPPPNVVFMLVTTDLDKVKDTVVSRCFSCEFTRIPEAELAQRIRDISDAEGFSFSSELCTAIATRSRGVARNAVMMAEQAALVHVRTSDQLTQLLGIEDHGLAVVRALVAGPDYVGAFEAAGVALGVLPGPREVVGSVVSTLKRLLVLTMSESGSSLSPPPSADEKVLASRLDSARCVAGMRVVWEYYSRIQPSSDAHAALDLVVTLLGQALCPGGVGQVKAKGGLTASEMAAMVRN